MSAAVPLTGSAAIPQAEGTVPASTQDEMDAAVAAVKAQKDAWVATSVHERIALLEGLRADLKRVMARWVAAAIEAKQIPPGSTTTAEEWTAGPFVTLRNLRLLVRSLSDIASQGTPKLPGKVTVNAHGKTVVPVFPSDFWDGAFYGGVKGEIWLQEGIRPADIAQHQATIYQTPQTEGKVALVLGAGNVSSIGPMDAFYKLFVENQVVVLKMNPVNEYLGPFFVEAFARLIDRGFLRVTYGGAAEGAYLCEHPDVEEIHITGSDKTHDAIVWGRGEEGAKNKAASTPRNTRRVTSELGNVSPVIVVPGPWKAKDIQHHASSLASMLTNNGGFNCNATRVIINHASWSQRQDLMRAIEGVFREVPARNAYYPGAAQRWQSFKDVHPEATVVGGDGQEALPWTIVEGLDPAKTDDICFNTEAFCSVTSEVGLDGASTAEYIRKAVDFCNDKLWGTLSASLIIHPASLKDPEVKAAYTQAIADLRYGAIAINDWPALAYGLVTTTWGAYPGHPLDDVQSGIGVVHNTYMLEGVEKSVVYTPFRPFPRPPWNVLNKTAHLTARRACDWEAEPGLGKAFKIISAALRG